MDTEYFIMNNGAQAGPFTLQELLERQPELHTGIRRAAESEWTDACDMPELFDYFLAKGYDFPTEDNLASFGWRLLGYVVDYLLLSFLVDLVFMVLANFGITFNINAITLKTLSDPSKVPVGEMLAIEFIWLATLIIYNAICEASPMKGSIGKRIFRMVVVDADGARLSFPRAMMRSIGKAISVFFLYLGFLSILFTEHKQALHDYLAKTYVVKRS